MDDAYGADVQHDGVIDVVYDNVQSIRNPLSAHVQFRRESQSAFPQTRIVLGGPRLDVLPHRGFIFIGRDPLNPVERHFAGDVADGDGHCLVGHPDDLTGHAVVFHPHFLSYLQHAAPELLGGLRLAVILGFTLAGIATHLSVFQLLEFLFYVVIVIFLFVLLLCLER